LAAAVVLGLSLNGSFARPPYKKEFDEKYVKKDSTDPAEKALATAVEGAKCNVCHGKNAEGKDDKKVRNSYAQAICKHVMNNEKDNQKIIDALDSAAKEKSKADYPSSPTFGDLIKGGKLPSP